VEKYRTTDLLLAKNKIEFVFFTDDAWFTMSRKVKGKSNRWCYENSCAVRAVFCT
jgi:hypothetical protein